VAGSPFGRRSGLVAVELGDVDVLAVDAKDDGVAEFVALDDARERSGSGVNGDGLD
jgi:hypothetical protein